MELLRDGKGRNRIGCDELGRGGKGRYIIGPNGIERNWLGEDGTGRDATGGGRMAFPLFPN